MDYLKLGERIRRFRKTAGLSLEQLSERTGLPVSQIERFESDQEQPLIAHLIKLSKAMQVNVADIFRERPAAKAFEIVRSEERSRIRPLLERSKAAKVFDYIYSPLTQPSADKHIDAYLIELAPRSGRPPNEDVTHEGEEFIFMLEGELRGEIGGEKFHLKQGDSLFLRSTSPHVFYNPTDKPSRALTVIYPY